MKLPNSGTSFSTCTEIGATLLSLYSLLTNSIRRISISSSSSTTSWATPPPACIYTGPAESSEVPISGLPAGGFGTSLTAAMKRFSCSEDLNAFILSDSSEESASRSMNTHWLPLPQSASGDSLVTSMRSTVFQFAQSVLTKLRGALPYIIAGRSAGLSGTAALIVVFASASADIASSPSEEMFAIGLALLMLKLLTESSAPVTLTVTFNLPLFEGLPPSVATIVKWQPSPQGMRAPSLSSDSSVISLPVLASMANDLESSPESE